MIISNTRTIVFRGRNAFLQVLRNNGFCWGRITLPTGEEYDVEDPGEDWYDHPDDDALDAFEDASDNPDNVEPVP